MMNKEGKIYVAGHRGMVGSAIVRSLERNGYHNIITRTHKELDLTRQDQVEKFFAEEKPDYVFLAAAKVGGIVANSEALADFMYDNMILEMNVIHEAWKNNCKKLLFLGSSCIYPRMAPQPMKENCLLTSELEKTNEAYALAKISGLKYCEFLNRQYGTDYISCMPTNLYGPNDNYHPTHSHVLPALIRRFHEAKEQGLTEVTCWGTGSPLREFLYVDDLADGCVFLMKIGDKLASGEPHDGRAPDYDDWQLNGDILFWFETLNCALEISSMGIRVDEKALEEQLVKAGCEERKNLPYHKMLLNGELPYTIGGGIGQSRLCMLLLDRAHVGEVQASLWPEQMRKTCKEHSMILL